MGRLQVGWRRRSLLGRGQTVLTPASESGEGESILTRILASGSALVVCAALMLAYSERALPWNGSWDKLGPTAWVVGVIAAFTATLPWIAPRHRSGFVLAGSLVVGAMVTRWLIVLPVAFAWLVAKVTRQSWSTVTKLALLLGVWLGVVLLKWHGPRLPNVPWGALALYWGCLPAPVIWLIADSARLQPGERSEQADWIYLLALPRFFMPFLQPVGPRSLAPAPRLTRALALSALGLGLWAVLWLVLMKHLHYSVKAPHEQLELRHARPIAQNLALIYAVNAGKIFCAVALLRLLGFQLGSGFNRPLLATSFADAYRRWNYYFYEYVTAVFYLPLVNWLRRRVPLKLAYVLAGYPSILLGVWVLDNVTFQLAMGNDVGLLLEQLADRGELLGYAVIWSLIIVPQVLFTPLRGLRRFIWWRWAARLLTLAAAAGVLTALFYFQIALY